MAPGISSSSGHQACSAQRKGETSEASSPLLFCYPFVHLSSASQLAGLGIRGMKWMRWSRPLGLMPGKQGIPGAIGRTEVA